MIHVLNRTGIIFFDNELYIKLFLTICLAILAIYLFFLHSKVTYWKMWLSRQLLKNKQYKFSRKMSRKKIAGLQQSPIVSNPNLELVFSDAEHPETKEPVETTSSNPAKIETNPEEEEQLKHIIDRILKRNTNNEKKLRLLRILWIVLVVLTTFFIITY